MIQVGGLLFKIYFSIFLLILSSFLAELLGQGQLYRKSQFDVQHYRFNLKLQDNTDEITGSSVVTFEALQDLSKIELDLIQSSGETGMSVEHVLLGGSALSFSQNQDKLIIEHDWKKENKYNIEIQYKGIPGDGLIIGQNKYGSRTFFGDNWPNRARHWLPTVDHPSDKATVEFIVEAPVHYEVVATGIKLEERYIEANQKITHYTCPNPLPTKVMVIGVARFAIQYAGDAYGHPVSSWVYPEDWETGYQEYYPAVDILKYFIDKVAPYPNLKLANVQSKTRYGGMENAGNIFYYENSIDGKVDDLNLIAHEIAHQWFGNSASELDWHHVWLSEGFATYMTNAYIEDTKGVDSLRSYLDRQRKQVITYFQRNPAPVIDTTITNFNRVLSTNSYQKAGWFLHMLRRNVGNQNFWKGVKTYYNQYKYSNALTKDFQIVMEEVSGMNLEQFFYQWLYISGHPQLSISFVQNKKKLEVKITQNQDFIYDFPLEISFRDGKGKSRKVTIPVADKITVRTLKSKGVVTEMKIDPDTNLLHELIEVF